MKQGLLFKDAPEGRFELYCHSYIPGTGSNCCELIFDNIAEYRKHTIKVHEIDWCIRELPSRPLRRFHVTQKQLTNIKNKKCWCGKSKDQWKKNKYDNYECWNHCCKKHYKDWWLRCDNVAFHRHKFMHQASRICEICGEKGIDTPFRSALEMDHIIAIVLGGHPWHYDNLQMICSECHKMKTKSDVGILAAWRKMSNYDLGPMVPNPQLTLDNELNYNYVYH